MEESVVGKVAKEVKAYPILVGSTGLVHCRTLQYLMDCGMPKNQAKGLCKWMPNSNIMAARDIWSIRCRLAKE